MQAAAAKYLPHLRTYLKQIIPPVLATLIAALLIAGFNRAFSVHLVQPRMAAMHAGAGDEEARPVGAKTRDIPAAEIGAFVEPTPAARVFVKDNDREAGKDQATLKIAVAPPAPVPPVTAAPAPAVTAAPVAAITAAPVAAPAAPRVVQRPIDPPRVATAPLAPSPTPVVVAAPIATQPAYSSVAPMMQQPIAQQPVTQEPPAVIAAKPMVTVPDRPQQPQQYGQQPWQQQQQQWQQQQAEREKRWQAEQQQWQQQQAQHQVAQDAPPAQPRVFDRFVDSMKPSSIFSRMREFGDKIEAAGNDILPTIRQ
jgi:hypothetical protein